MSSMKYTVKLTTAFKKDYKQAGKRGLNLELLDTIITALANGEPLAEKHRDHALTGNWGGFRECHIGPDWLLIYRIENGVLVLTLARTGTHSDLFGKEPTKNSRWSNHSRFDHLLFCYERDTQEIKPPRVQSPAFVFAVAMTASRSLWGGNQTEPVYIEGCIPHMGIQSGTKDINSLGNLRQNPPFWAFGAQGG